MKTFKKLALAAVVTALSANMTLAQEVTLRFQHFLSPKGAVPAYFITPWAEKVEKDSGGRIKVEIYPAMQLGGKPPALYDQIRDGVIDGGWAIPAYTPGRFPKAEALELPFISSIDAEVASRVAWDFYEKHLTDSFSDIKILAVHVHGPGVIHTNGKPVNSLEDMNGLKLRTPSRVASSVLEAAGAVPIGMPLPSFPESLAKGVVDGGIIPWEVVVPLKVNELADNHTILGGDTAFYNTTFIWGMNKAKYDSLPDDLKAVIDANSGLEASAWAGRAMNTGDIPSREATEAAGNNIIRLSEEETARWKELAAPILDQWVEEMEGKGLPGAEMIQDVRALAETYAK